MHQSPPSSENPPAASSLDQAIEVVDQLRVFHGQSQEKLRDLGMKLRSIQREQKAGNRELQTLKQHLRGLQSMRI